MGGGWSKARIAWFHGLRSHANGARNLVTARMSLKAEKEKARRMRRAFC